MADDTSTRKDSEPRAGPSVSSGSRTHWSVVFAAGRDSSPEARAAFGALYRAYSPALLAYLRQHSRWRDGAMDLLHGFFEHLLRGKGLSTVERKGRFRSWMLRSLKHFAADVWDRDNAGKRGGGREHVRVGPDRDDGEVEPMDSRLTPEQAYDRKWAVELLKRVLYKLAGEYAQAGKQRLFDALKQFLSGKGTDDDTNYKTIGEQLQMPPNSVAVAVKRLRERYRELLWAEISDTVEPEMVEAEWRHLMEAVSTPSASSGSTTTSTPFNA